jgi:hypothetical protein
LTWLAEKKARKEAAGDICKQASWSSGPERKAGGRKPVPSPTPSLQSRQPGVHTGQTTVALDEP